MFVLTFAHSAKFSRAEFECMLVTKYVSSALKKQTWIASSFLPILAWNSALVPPNRWKYHWTHPWSQCLSQCGNQIQLEVCKAFLPKSQYKVRTWTCRIFTFYIISQRLNVPPAVELRDFPPVRHKNTKKHKCINLSSLAAMPITHYFNVSDIFYVMLHFTLEETCEYS